jgi:8-oxo-dGTP pyrophosphatase MutT (NUDIX family)
MAFFNANRKKLEAQGVDVDEWNASSKGKKLPEKVASLTSSIAPITEVAGNVDMAFKNPKKLRQKSLSDRLTDIVDAEDTLNDPETDSLGHSIGTGALAGGLLMGTKGVLMAGGNPQAATTFTGLGAGIGAGVGGLKHLLYKATKRKRDRNARRTMAQAFNFDKSILDDPEVRDEVAKYRSAKYGPLFGAEGGATIGSLGGAVYKAMKASPEGPRAQLLGRDLPMSQAKAEAAGTGGLYGGLAGLGVGLAAGYGYKWYRRRALRNLLKKKLTTKTAELTLDISKGDTLLGGKFKNVPTVVEDIGTDELGQPTINGKKLLAFRIKKTMPAKLASLWLKDNKGHTTDLSGGRPMSSSNRSMMHGQDVEHYSAGMPEERYPFTPPTEQPQKYSAGTKVSKNKLMKKRGEVLIGGEADGKPATDYPAKEVVEGAQHETEHTKSPQAAVEIAKDHLEEDKYYYSKLEKMEKEAGLATSIWNFAQKGLPAAKKTVAPQVIKPITIDGAGSSTRTISNFANPYSSWNKTIKPFQEHIRVPAGLPATVYGKTPTDVPALSDMASDLMKRTTTGWQDMRTRASNVANTVASKLTPGWAASLGSSVGMASQAIPAIQAKQKAHQATPAAAPADAVWAGQEGMINRKVASVKEAGMTLRERAEVIVHKDGKILAIKKPGYLLMPGGGLNEDETAEQAVTREAIEEADQLLKGVRHADEVRVAYIGEGPSKGFDGELTHFYTAQDGGKSGTTHADRESFEWIDADDALVYLTELLADPEQAWAFDNNIARIKAIESVMPDTEATKEKLQDAEIVRADTIEKKADVASFLPKSEFVLFSKDGKLVVKRGKNRRFDLPNMGVGSPVPYEKPVQFLPPEGVPEPGAHGYEIGLRMGETDTVPEGYEAVDPQSALKDMYASMGMSANRPYQSLDRARARAIVRYLKKKQKSVTQVPHAQV